MLNFSSGNGATDEKNCVSSFFVCQDYNNWAVREDASTKTCPERDCGATSISIIFSHVTNVYWVLGTKSRTLWRCCEPVVRQVLTQCFEHPEIANKKCVKFSHYMYFSPGFLRRWRVSTAQTSISQYEVGRLHYSDTFVVSVYIHDKT